MHKITRLYVLYMHQDLGNDNDNDNILFDHNIQMYTTDLQ